VSRRRRSVRPAGHRHHENRLGLRNLAVVEDHRRPWQVCSPACACDFWRVEHEVRVPMVVGIAQVPSFDIMKDIAPGSGEGISLRASAARTSSRILSFESPASASFVRRSVYARMDPDAAGL